MARAPAKPVVEGTTPPKPARKRAAPKPPAAPAAPPPAAPRKPAMSLPSLESSSTQLRKTILNLAFVLAILLFIPILVSQFLRDQVRIEPIDVPEALLERGMTPDVIASRLWDGLQDATDLAGSSKTSIDAIPNSQRIEFSVPEVGLSLDSVVRQARHFFNLYQTSVSGEFVCADAACTPEGMRLRLRVSRGATEVIDLPPLGDMSLRSYFRDAAVEVLSSLDPFIAIAAISVAEPVRATTLARRLIRQQHPDAKWAHLLIGNMKSESGDDRSAWAEYRAALQIDPSFFLAKANMAGALRRLGDPVAARKLYEELEASHPNLAKSAEGFAELAAGAGDLDGAIALFQKAAEIEPTNPLYVSRIGQIEYERGNQEVARGWFSRALELNPAYPLATESMMTDYFSRGDFAGAEAILRAAVEYAPDDIVANTYVAVVYILSGQHAEALAALDRALAITPDDPGLLFEAGKTLQALDRLDESIIRLDRAIELDPYNPAPLMSRSTALAVMGRKEEARADFERIIEVDTTGLYAPQATTFLTILDDMDLPAAEPPADVTEATP